MNKEPHPTALGRRTGTLGTFAGVFTPSVLTILGIILFLRLGYVVGSAGFGRALIIIGLANVISVLTSVSLSAVATNLKVKGGGDYYLISRTLGMEYGGSIGLVLFLAQSVSIAFYCIGFGEALGSMLNGSPGFLSPRIIAVLAVAFLFVFAWLGADWATKFQFLVMALLFAALFSFFYGGIPQWDQTVLSRNWGGPVENSDFWILFAIFFPAVTGFTQGVSMSGDLKNPGKSLPTGTFLAVGVSIAVYFGAAVIFSGVLHNDILSADYSAMKRVARWPVLVDAGVVAATLSSAMASFLGAPRILQSLAGDRIFPILLPFAKGSGPMANPRRGVLLSAGIALLTISLGNLNLIAPVVSMFFLISYGLLNYATYFEARAESPSFRPRFKWFDRRISLLGFLACAGVMLAIDLKTGIVAISILLALFQYLKRTAGPARWADSRRAYHLQRARENLLAAYSDPEHPRDWRPQILAFSNDPLRRNRLLELASWLEGRSGLTTLVTLVEGKGLKVLKQRNETEKELRADLINSQSDAFPLALATPDFESGVYALLQAAGIGPLRVNTILLNWLNPDSPVSRGFKEFLFGRHLRTVYRLGCSIVVLHTDEEKWKTMEERPESDRRIDVWWQGDATSRLMLLFAYLMTRSNPWEDAAIRVLSKSAGNQDDAAEKLQNVLDEARIEAEPMPVGDSDIETIAALTRDAAVVFLPFRLQGNLIAGPAPGRIEELLTELSPTVMVLAAEDIDLDAEPEEGQAGEMAAALDEMTDSRTKAEETEKEAVSSAEEAEAVKKRIEEMENQPSTDETDDMLAQLRAEVVKAEEKAEKARRRAAKAKAKADAAAKETEDRYGVGKVTEDTDESSDNN